LIEQYPAFYQLINIISLHAFDHLFYIKHEVVLLKNKNVWKILLSVFGGYGFAYFSPVIP